MIYIELDAPNVLFNDFKVRIRNFLMFNVSYFETSNMYKNELGKTIIFPIRSLQRKIDLEIECCYPEVYDLINIFEKPTINFNYNDNIYGEASGTFRKISDIQITAINRSEARFGCNCLYRTTLSDKNKWVYARPENSTGIYNFKISLEEV